MFYSQLASDPITLKDFVPEEITENVNDEKSQEPPSEDPEIVQVFEKAQRLAHFNYSFSNEKHMMVDIQESKYKL